MSNAYFAAKRAQRTDRRNAAPFKVRSLNKSGAVSRSRDFCVAQTMEEAVVKKAYLEKVNPGRQFVITAE